MKNLTKLLVAIVLLIAIGILGHQVYLWGRREIQQELFPIRYEEYVLAAAEKHDIEPALIFAVILAESSFRSYVISPAGAGGLMQLMPSTFEWLVERRRLDYVADDVFNPAVNIDFGAYYLRMQYNRFGNWDHALMAYNAGSGTVSSWLNNPELTQDGLIIHDRIPFRETRNYVQRVNNALAEYRRLYYEGHIQRPLSNSN